MPKVCLLILDGFGLGDGDPRVDARAAAHLPFLTTLFATYPWIELDASGPAVGLAPGQFGNSEIGHLTMGAGRVLPGIDRVISEKLQKFHPRRVFGATVGIVGIYSTGRVHGNKEHIDTLTKYFVAHHHRVVLHLISDGRDTGRHAFLSDLDQLLAQIDPQWVTIGSISGRFYAMDRDHNQDRVDRAYAAMDGQVVTPLSPREYVSAMYAAGYDDETLPPASFGGPPLAVTTNLVTNYRPDRIVALLKTFQAHGVMATTLVNLHQGVGGRPLLRTGYAIRQTLDEILSAHHLSQLRVAETEKYAHVTYFFDGGRNVRRDGKETILIPSNKVANHATMPAMKAVEITDAILERADQFDVVVANYANPDMLGHTGDLGATIRGLEVIDQQIERIYNRIFRKSHCWLIITADHGNVDQMVRDGEPLKTHTNARVPFLIADRGIKFRTTRGTLAQIAPTVLTLLGIPKPPAMTAESLISGETRAKT